MNFYCIDDYNCAYILYYIRILELGESRIVELIPNGANTPVTNETKYQYVFRVANYRLNTQIDKQCKAFFKGLSDLIDPKWLQMFNQVSFVFTRKHV